MLTSYLIILALTGPGNGPGSPSLSVETAGGWRRWWVADQAPERWNRGSALLRSAVTWRSAAGGVNWGELRLSGSGEAWRVKAVLVRFDPRRVALQTTWTPDRLNRRDRWSVDEAPADALFALNGGQFNGLGPWGWVVRDGVEYREPGRGPLAPAIVVDTAGSMTFVPAERIDEVRRRGGVRLAFQSYPAILLEDGTVPEPLRTGEGVSLTHRDGRLGLCELRSGEWLIALTRFEGLGGVLSSLPFGLTTPEMAALMGALDCRQAVLLDGGISAQLMVREDDGSALRWSGLRRVPSGMVAFAR